MRFPGKAQAIVAYRQVNRHLKGNFGVVWLELRGTVWKVQ